MTSIRVPAHLQSTAKELGLKSWINKKSFPIDDFCETIDDLRDVLSIHCKVEKDQISDAALTTALAAVFDEEGALLEHVLNEVKTSVDDPETWNKHCQAASWVVLQRYYNRLSNGEWPKDD